MSSRLLILACSFLLTGAAAPSEQDSDVHRHDEPERLGTADFPISCNPEAQRLFNRGVAWLHSFEYEPARRTFEEAAAADPRCAMSHWGVAMSQYHPLWAAPTPAELALGRSAIERARGSGGSARERDYIAALQAFYEDAGTVDHRTRTFAYETAMERLHSRYPSDDEAAIFYALALIAAGTLDADETFARERRAAELLNGVFARAPDHPGIAHYLIHSYDYPPLAHLALAAARRYAAIAPASAHAQHMPSHIFIRLGLWEEAIRSNIAAEAAARAYAAHAGLPGAWDEQLHAMDYLAYAYLQSGQDGNARQIVQALEGIARVDPPNFKAAYTFAAVPARFALERRRWDEAAALALSPNARQAVRWAQFRWAEAAIHFARAVGAARSGDAERARIEVEALQAIRDALVIPPGEYDWARQVDIQRQIAAAWLAATEGEAEQALRLMRAAAALDDATEKHPVSPGAILPAREQLGELLLELERPGEALAEYEAALTRAPNRLAGLYGAARAARLAGDADKARLYYGRLLEVSRGADGDRSELREASAFLANGRGG